jgi:hypothetical protein
MLRNRGWFRAAKDAIPAVLDLGHGVDPVLRLGAESEREVTWRVFDLVRQAILEPHLPDIDLDYLWRLDPLTHTRTEGERRPRPAFPPRSQAIMESTPSAITLGSVSPPKVTTRTWLFWAAMAWYAASARSCSSP